MMDVWVLRLAGHILVHWIDVYKDTKETRHDTNGTNIWVRVYVCAYVCMKAKENSSKFSDLEKTNSNRFN